MRNQYAVYSFPCGSSGTESACNLETWVQSLGLEDPLETGNVNTPVFWPGEFHGLYSPWGLKESDTIEQLSLFSCLEQNLSIRGTTPHQLLLNNCGCIMSAKMQPQ